MTSTNEEVRPVSGADLQTDSHTIKDTMIATDTGQATLVRAAVAERARMGSLERAWAAVTTDDLPAQRARPGGSRGGASPEPATTTTVDDGVVVVSLPSESGTTTPLGYKGRASMKNMVRVVDMADILSRPEEPIQWAIEDFAQRGALTVLAARGGTGKSWLGIEACAAVQAGRPFIGLEVEQGHAVYVDGEMGPRQMAGRFRAGGLDPKAFTVLDAVGLDLGSDDGCAALERNLSDLAASFAVVDSLRRLTPGRRESDSDDMAPVLGNLAVMAKNLDMAVVVIHHGGWNGERAYRGSTAIGDQADAVLALERDGDALRLFCDPDRGCKMRGAPEPPPRWLRLAISEKPGVVVVSAPTPSGTTTPGRPTAAERMKGELLDLFARAERPMRKDDAAGGLRVAPDNQNFRRAWNDLVKADAVVETSDGFRLAEDVAHEAPREAGAS